MGLEERLLLYDELEKLRNKPLITYVTSSRVIAGATMAADVIGEVTDQLQALPGETKELDFLIVS